MKNVMLFLEKLRSFKRTRGLVYAILLSTLIPVIDWTSTISNFLAVATPKDIFLKSLYLAITLLAALFALSEFDPKDVNVIMKDVDRALFWIYLGVVSIVFILFIFFVIYVGDFSKIAIILLGIIPISAFLLLWYETSEKE